MIRLFAVLLFALAGCAADPLVEACAPFDHPVAYANCRLGPLGARP